MVKVIPDRDKRIITAALELAEVSHFQAITRDEVAERAGVSAGTVSNVFGRDMLKLKRAVLRHAIEVGNLTVLCQGLGERHPIALAAPADLRQKALATLVS